MYIKCFFNKKTFDVTNIDTYISSICTNSINIKPIPIEYSSRLDEIIKLMLNRNKEKRPTVEEILKHQLFSIDHASDRILINQSLTTNIASSYINSYSESPLNQNLDRLSRKNIQIKSQEKLNKFRNNAYIKTIIPSEHRERTYSHFIDNIYDMPKEIKFIVDIIMENKEINLPKFS